MIVVISQPMLFPWVGLLEQLRLADTYVHYSDVQFSKGSFVNRVQLKTAAGSKWITVPLTDLRLGQHIDEVRISESDDWRSAHLRQLREAYAEAPFLEEMLGIVESVYACRYADIGRLAEASLMALCSYFALDQGRSFLHSAEMDVDGSGSERVLGIVREAGGTTYVTGHGARRYLDHESFERAGVRVEYIDYAKLPYTQLHGDFLPYVSSLDLIANMGRTGISRICSRSKYWKDFLNNDPDTSVPG